MSLLAMNSLYEKRVMISTYGPKYEHLMPSATTVTVTVCFTQCTLFLSTRLFSIANMFAVRYLWKN